MTPMVTSQERIRQFLGVSLYRNALYLIIANLLVPFTGMVFWIIASRFYSTEDVGLVSALISAMYLLATLATLGLDFGLVRFLSSAGQNASRVVNSSLMIIALVAVILCGIFVAGIGIWSPDLGFLQQNSAYLSLFLLVTVATSLGPVVNNSLIAQRRSGFVVIIGLIFGLSRLPLPILLAAFLNSLGIFISWGISVVVALIAGVLFFLPRAQPGYSFFPVIHAKTIKAMMGFSVANYSSNLLWLLPGFSLPLIVLRLGGAEANAHFYVAWLVGTVLAVIPSATSMSLFAEGSYDEQQLIPHTLKALKLTAIILIPAALLVIFIADKLLILFGSSYSDSSTMLLRLLAFASLPIAVNSIYFSIMRVAKKLVVIIGMTVFIATVTLTLSYWLIPRIGINGVGIAWVGSHGVIALAIAAGFLLKHHNTTVHRLGT
jgi:O-antigen/teichoic acid export membrane protein